MIVKFTGFMHIAPEDIPDDIGSVDHWLMNFIASASRKDTDDAFDEMNLRWEVVHEREVPNKGS